MPSVDVLFTPLLITIAKSKPGPAVGMVLPSLLGLVLASLSAARRVRPRGCPAACCHSSFTAEKQGGKTLRVCRRFQPDSDLSCRVDLHARKALLRSSRELRGELQRRLADVEQ